MTLFPLLNRSDGLYRASFTPKASKKLTIWLLIVSVLFLSACGGGNSDADNNTSTNLRQFAFLKTNNPELSEDLYLQINNSNITGRVINNIKLDSLIATFIHDGDQISVNNVVQESDNSKNDFTQVVTYIVETSDGMQQSYQVDVTKFTGLPIIYIDTNGSASIDSKDDYIEGFVTIDGGRSAEDLAESAMKIRGRGNSTWWIHPKKPFQMKLAQESEFLGMPSNRKWLFLAEYSDKTMLRNTIAFEMGHISSLDWTPKSSFSEVYLNNEYNGTYNITQKVEEADDRVAIGDTGYLLEIDQLDRLDADDVYFYSHDFLINIKAPEIEMGSVQYNYVSELIKEFESALHGQEFSNSASGYAKYIDIDSFIDWYLISEITKNVDSKSFSSIYLNVLPGEKIKMGPLWDFDLSFGNVDYADSRYPDGFWVKDHPWYARLFQDPAFVSKIKERFAFFKNNQDYIINKIEQHAQMLQWAQQENNNKWQTIGIYVWPNPVIFNTYQEEVAHLKNWYQTRMAWLDNAFSAL